MWPRIFTGNRNTTDKSGAVPLGRGFLSPQFEQGGERLRMKKRGKYPVSCRSCAMSNRTSSRLRRSQFGSSNVFTGRQGRQPIRAAARPALIRSRWSLNLVRKFTIFQVGNTGRQGRQPIRAAARPALIRSRWSLNLVKKSTIFRVNNTGRSRLEFPQHLSSHYDWAIANRRCIVSGNCPTTGKQILAKSYTHRKDCLNLRPQRGYCAHHRDVIAAKRITYRCTRAAC
jgi:hypothetical protein